MRVNNFSGENFKTNQADGLKGETRVGSSAVPGESDLNVNIKAGPLTNSLKYGDLIKAQVLSNNKGAVVLKTDSGNVFRARLDAETQLLPGKEILLEFSGKEKGNITLAIVETDAGTDETSGEIQGGKAGSTEARGEVTEKSRTPDLTNYENKLTELNLPATSENVSMMREIRTQNPDITLDEAAFLASNKLTGDENLIKAALALLSGSDKADAIIEQLLALLKLPAADISVTQNQGFGIQNPELEIQNPIYTVQTGEIGQKAPNQESTSSPLIIDSKIIYNSEFGIRNSELSPLTDWITRFGEGVPGENRLAEQVFQPPAPNVKPIITHSDSIMQSLNVENVENDVEIILNGNEATDQSAKNAVPSIPNSELRIPVSTAQTDKTQPTPNTEHRIPDSPAQTDQSQPIPNSEIRIPNSNAVAAITSYLTEKPEFRDTPISAIDRFANMLLRVVSDDTNTAKGDADKLVSLLDKLFIRIGKNDEGGGERLRNAREELYLRLTLIDEEISRSSTPFKTQMLEQTQRLIDNAHITNRIDQFAYMQLPVKFHNEYKTADLYVFKKNGGRRADPENVNILLALELENIGHWEALINFRNKDVSIQMEVPGEKEKEHFSENTVMLHAMLAEAGFKLVNTDIKYTKHKTTPSTALSSLKKYTSAHKGMIDYLV